MWVNAKGPCRRAQPAGSVTTEVANYLRIAWKWGPRRPRWFIAKGMRRIVAEEATRRLDLLSLVKFALFPRSGERNRSFLSRWISTISQVRRRWPSPYY
jgi:hypothetical protein